MRVVSFNVENLFIEAEQGLTSLPQNLTEFQWQSHSTRLEGQKQLFKLRALAQCIQDLDADIFMLCEVGGETSLQHFNRLFLQNFYRVFTLPSNSDRGIDLAYLVHPRVSLRVSLQSNVQKNLLSIDPSDGAGKFARDILELSLWREKKCLWHFMLVHLKSKRESHGDFQGQRQRQREVLTLLQHYQQRKKQFPEAAFVIAGDFNGRAQAPQPEKEFLPIYQHSSLQDVLQVANAPRDYRCTYQLFTQPNRFEGLQLDYIFIDPSQLKCPKAFVYFFQQSGHPVATLKEKDNLPSDHFPIFAHLERS